jgi:hypothetical protein
MSLNQEIFVYFSKHAGIAGYVIGTENTEAETEISDELKLALHEPQYRY